MSKILINLVIFTYKIILVSFIVAFMFNALLYRIENTGIEVNKQDGQGHVLSKTFYVFIQE